MNLREGTRRLALLLGMAGAIFGGFLSYSELQSLMRQRSEHQQFEKLANTDEVKQERKARQLGWIVTDTDGRPVDPNASVINANGIGTIHWTADFAIEYIETQDGQMLFPAQLPGAWSYILIAVFPLLGFFIPWGVVRGLGWVVAGFVQPSH